MTAHFISMFDRLGLPARRRLAAVGWLVASLSLTAGTCSIDVSTPTLTAGASHACAYNADDDGTYCWGDNTFGQLGNGAFNSVGEPKIVAVSGMAEIKVISLAAGYAHTCALLANQDGDADNSVSCWGYNAYGQLGDNSSDDRNTPVKVVKADGSPLKGISAISAGAYHTCATPAKDTPDQGKIFCWGRNHKGQIGNGTFDNAFAAVEVSGIGPDFKNAGFGVAAGTAHTCALYAGSEEEGKNPRVFCWGDTSRGQTAGARPEGGQTASPTPIDIGLSLQGIQSLQSEHSAQADAAGREGGREIETSAYGQTCARTATALTCWGGNNQYGQMGTTSVEYGGFVTLTAQDFGTGANLGIVSIGSTHACANVSGGPSAGTVCWGYSSALGLPAAEGETDGPAPLNRTNGSKSNFAQIAVGHGFSCAADVGAVYCWGRGDKGQIGIGDFAGRREAVCVPGFRGCDEFRKPAPKDEVPIVELPGAVPAFTQISARYDNGCGVTSDGGVKCWGSAFSYRSGTGGNIVADPPALNGRAKQVGVGNSHACAAMEDGAVQCWGSNLWGALGDGSGSSGGEAVTVTLPGTAKQAVAGYYFGCALLDNGEAYCWGDGSGGALGGGAFGEENMKPAKVKGLRAKAVSLTAHGRGHYVDLYGVKRHDLEVNGFVCARLEDGGVQCWSDNLDAQLGNGLGGKYVGDRRDRSFKYQAYAAEPGAVVVSGLAEPVIDVSAGNHFACAVGRSGAASCWGVDLYGETGTGADLTKAALSFGPKPVVGLSGAASIASGEYSTCALTSAGIVKCWGKNSYGNLGLPKDRVAQLSTPGEPVGTLSNVIQVDSGDSHSCALLASGEARCWGSNYSKQLGAITPDPESSTPVTVMNGSFGERVSAEVSPDSVDETLSPVAITIAVSPLAGDFEFAFDCDHDGSFEVALASSGHTCEYQGIDSGVRTVPIRIRSKIVNDQEKTEVVNATFVVRNIPPVVADIKTSKRTFPAGSADARFKINSVSASDPIDTLTYGYDCNLDGVIAGPDEEDLGPSNVTCDLTDVAAGSYALNVVVSDDDSVDGDGTVTKPILITIEAERVDTTFTARPGAYSAAATTFAISSPDSTSLECKLDGASFAVCTSPVELVGLADGSHTFAARGVRDGKPDPTPASHTWIVDTILPVTVIDTTFVEPVGTASVQIDFSTIDLNPGTFWCNLNSLGWEACTSGSSFGPVAEGTHSLEVTAVDAAGNADLTPEIAIWSYWIPPETTINSGPAAGGWSTSATTTFTFSSATATGFECSLDSGAFADCTSPHELTGLGEGAHTFEVRAVRNGVPDATPASRTFTVDTIAPDTTIDSGPAATVIVADATLTFSGTGSPVGFLCSLDGAAGELCSGSKNYTVAEGEHTVEIAAIDAAGNIDPTPATRTWRYVIEPDTTIEAGLAPYSDTTTSVAFSSPTTDVFECNFDDGGWAGCASPYVNNSLSAGSHTLQVRAVKYGVPDPSPASHTWTAYTVPETDIDTPLFSYSGASTQIAFSSPTAGGTLFVCRLNSDPFVDCASPKTLSGLTPGSYTFEVSAYNPAGFDPSAAAISWTVRNLPTTTILSDPGATSGSGVTFTFSGTDADGFECSIDGGAYVACTSPKSYASLSAGSHTFRVRAVNLTGADATPAEHTWDVLALPDTTIDSGPVTDSTSGVDVSFTFSSADGSATFECSLDGAAYGACTSPKDYTGLSEAPHVFRVRAVNGLGADDSPAVVAWTVATGGGGGGVAAQARSLATGGMHSCAVTAGSMYCWGTNGAGQLGDVSGAHFNPSQMGTDTDWAMVAAGEFHTCAVKTTGKLWCWGAGASGQLGQGLAQDEASPVAVDATNNWLTVVGGVSHTCAVRSDNTLWCWGDNSLGQLGQGTIDLGVSTPVQVGSAADWADVVAGSGHTCGLKTDGTVYCWGMNSMGELGNGQAEDYPAPLTAAATEVTQITSGSGHVCVVKSDGTLWCWGDNFSSQGGNAVADRTLASQVGTDTDWALVEAGIVHTCAIKTSGQLWCWGDQGNNALGDDASSGTIATPAQTGSDNDWQAVSCGQNFCIGTRAVGTYSWGDNMFSQCGLDGMFTPVVSPMELLTPYP